MAKGAILTSAHKPLPLPVPNAGSTQASHYDDDDAFVNEFTRNDLRELIHLITQELKSKGTKTPLLLLSFRPKSIDSELIAFLEVVLPTGKKLAKTSIIEQKVKSANEFTLISALKYLWVRLPMSSIIGWDAYESFKTLEKEKNYSKKAFLEFMPQCLSSPSHASIVYDFLDLIVSLAANAKENQMSGRKIAKMAAIWAFQGSPSSHDKKSSVSNEHNFVDGLQNWLPAANAMFHLLLSFLRSMLPDDDSTKLQLPRTLHALLASNSYPPPDITYTSSTLVSVPLITIKTNRLSSSPIEMLNRIPTLLSFEDKNQFQAKEDYALLKAFCKNDENIINKLSGESKRIIQLLSQPKSKQSTLYPGWPLQNQPNISNSQVKSNCEISRVPIDDYFIWAWLASISFEQPSLKKKIFGRSLILEIVFDGFKKWIIIEEVGLDFKLESSIPEKPKVKKTIQAHYKSMLDDVPDSEQPLQQPKKVRKPKQNAQPEVLVDSKSKPNSGKRNFSNTFLKKFQSSNKENQALPPPPASAQIPKIPQQLPKPLPKDQYESNYSYEPIELPEIEKEQYRLSIPLDSFDLGAATDAQNGYAQNGYANQYSTSPQQYKSLAPPSRDQLYAQNDQNIQKFNQEYKFWSSEEQHQAYPPQEQYQQGYDYQKINAQYQPYEQPQTQDQQQSNQYPEEDYHNQQIPLPVHQQTSDNYYRPPLSSESNNGSSGGSIENLNNMVDELSIQVNNVESKIGPGGNEEDRYYNRPISEPRPQSHNYQTPSSKRNQDSSRPTSKMFEPVRSSPRHQEPDLSYISPSHIKPVLSPIQTVEKVDPKPEIYVPASTDKGRRKTPTDFAMSATASVAATDFDPLESGVYASSSVYGPVPSTIGDAYDNDVNDDVETETDYVNPVIEHRHSTMIDDVENYLANQNGIAKSNSINPNNVRETGFSDNSYNTARTEASRVGVVDESKRSSVQSEAYSSKYPESIIETYRQPSVYHSNAVPEPISKTTPIEEKESNPLEDESNNLSAADISYIPDTTLTIEEESAIPIPSPPRSPMARARSPQLSKSNDDVPSNPLPPPPPPKVMLKELPQPDLQPPSVDPSPSTISQQQFEDSVSHFSDDEYYKTPSPSSSSIPQSALQQPSSYSTPQSQLYTRKSPEPSTENKQYRRKHPDTVSSSSSIIPPSETLQPQDQPQQRVRKSPAFSSNLNSNGRSKEDNGSYDNVVTPQKANDHPPISRLDPQQRSSPPEHQQQHPPQSYESPSSQPYQQKYPPQQSQQSYPPQQQHQSYPPQQSHQHQPHQQYPPQQQQRPPNSQQQRQRSPAYDQQDGRSPQRSNRSYENPNHLTPGPPQQRQSHQPRKGRSPNPSLDSRHNSPYRPSPPPQQQGYPPYMPYNTPRKGSPSGTTNSSSSSIPRVSSSNPSSGPRSSSLSPSRGPANYPPPYPPPGKGYYPPPPQGYPPQGYPPQGYPPQGYPPQGYPPQGYPPPPQGYPWYPPPPHGYYPPPPSSQGGAPPPSSAHSGGSGSGPGKATTSDVTLSNFPTTTTMNKLHHRPNNAADKKSMRNALVQGDFGI